MVVSVIVAGTWLFALGTIFTMGDVTSIVYAQNSSSNAVLGQETFDSKIQSIKNKVVEEIKGCEGAGYTEKDGVIIFDSNNKASIGLLQFQKNTVIYYYKVLYGKDITGKEAILIALDDTKATELARDIMFKTGNKAGKDWVTCSRKNDSDSKIDIIKQLEK
jgi:hypothetical protein